MKAVLLNSADKISGVQGSTRTVEDIFGNSWTDTFAFFDGTVPLDPFLGAGHLNARRALTQFSAGPISGAEIEKIGWHFGETGGVGTEHEYYFEETLQANEWVAVTLSWDRQILINGLIDYDETYDQSDVFTGARLEDLDLYVLPAASTGLVGATHMNASQSYDENLEHVFFQIPATGDYKIVVVHAGGFSIDQKYGLAWWVGDAPVDLDGDFDEDGDVDGDDLGEWEGGFGPGAGGDADGDGDTDGNDFLVWQQNLGMTSAAPVASAVPEPSAWLLCSLGPLVCFRGRHFNANQVLARTITHESHDALGDGLSRQCKSVGDRRGNDAQSV